MEKIEAHKYVDIINTHVSNYKKGKKGPEDTLEMIGEELVECGIHPSIERIRQKHKFLNNQKKKLKSKIKKFKRKKQDIQKYESELEEWEESLENDERELEENMKDLNKQKNKLETKEEELYIEQMVLDRKKEIYFEGFETMQNRSEKVFRRECDLINQLGDIVNEMNGSHKRIENKLDDIVNNNGGAKSKNTNFDVTKEFNNIKDDDAITKKKSTKKEVDKNKFVSSSIKKKSENKNIPILKKRGE